MNRVSRESGPVSFCTCEYTVTLTPQSSRMPDQSGGTPTAGLFGDELKTLRHGIPTISAARIEAYTGTLSMTPSFKWVYFLRSFPQKDVLTYSYLW